MYDTLIRYKIENAQNCAIKKSAGADSLHFVGIFCI
jgi:hypothetical protein